MSSADILKSINAPIKLSLATKEVVTAVQTQLVRLGYAIAIDGIPGPYTLTAFNSFKSSRHLGEPGVLGVTTASKLLEIHQRKATPDHVVAIACKELGYKESPASSNCSKFGQWYGMDAQPWCAMFVSWCFYKAGIPLPITRPNGFAYCPYGVQWFKKQGRFYKTPQVGDVVFFDFTRGCDGIADHVGIVEKVNSDGTVTTIEGNTSATTTGSQSNGGCVARRIRSISVIQGFGRPNW